MESITDIIANFEKRINDLQRDNDKLVGTINAMSDSIDGIKQTIICLDDKVSSKER